MDRCVFRGTFFLALVSLVTLGVSSPSFAAQEQVQSITYDGRLYNAAGTAPLADASVTFKFQIYNPAGTCLLYEESQAAVDLAASQGVFSLKVGSKISGGGKRTASDPGLSMADVFQNAYSVTVPVAICAGGAYTPAAGDARKLRVTVVPSSVGTAQVLSPDIDVNGVPSALVCESLQGKGPDQFVQTTGGAMTGSLTMNSSEVRFSDGTKYVGFKAPATVTAASSFVWKLPPQDGSVGQVIQTDGTGNLTWVNNGGAAGTVASVNGLAGVLSIAAGTTGADVNVSAAGAVVTVNVPDASALNRGAVTTGAQTFAGAKSFATHVNVLSQSELRLNDTGTNYVALRGPGTVTGNYTLTFPAAIGAAGQMLVSDASGNLSWSTPVNGASYVAKAGDTMTGALVLSADPTLNLHAATKQYVDNKASTDLANYVRKDGTTALTADWNAGAYNIAVDNQKAIKLFETDAAGTDFVALRAPSDVTTASGYTLTFPATVAGTAGQALTSDTSGNLSWTTISSAETDPQVGTIADGYVPKANGSNVLVQSNIFEDGTGKVGIGSVAPGSKLEVKDGNIALTNTGTAGEFRFYEPSASGSNYTAFKAQAQAADLTYIWPSAYPGSNMVLQTDSSGNLTWVADDTGTSGVTTMAAVGSAPNANAASISGVTLTLQPADATNPGVVTTGAQTLAGAKTFSSVVSVPLGAVGAPGLYFGADVNTGVWSPAADTFAISTNGAERLRVDSTGNIGIGVTGPASPLHVKGDVRIEATGDTDKGCLRYNTATNKMEFSDDCTSYQSFAGLAAGVTSFGAQTGAITFVTGTAGTNVALSNTGAAFTLDIPDASATARGVVTTGAQTVAGAKTFNSAITAVAGLQTNAQSTVKLGDSDTSNFVSLRAPATVATDFTLTFPNAVPGGNGQALVSDTSGNLTWSNSFLTAEVDPEVGMTTTGRVPRWNSTTLVDGAIFDDGAGKVGIGSAAPGSKLEVKDGNIALTNTGTAGEFRFYEPSASGSNYTAFKGQAQAADLTYIWPNAYPGSNMVLQSDTSGNLNWVADDTGTSGVTTMAAVGAVPNANGASISGVNLTLQPADATNPGVVTTGAQTIAGAKTFSSVTSVPLGAVGAPGLYFGADVDTGVWSPGANILAFSTAGAERARFAADGGYVLKGIPTASAPATSGASNGSIYFDSTSNTLKLSSNNGAYSDVGTLTAETDPQVGANTTDYLSKWNGSALVTSGVYENSGNVGIGTSTLNSKFQVNVGVDENFNVRNLGGFTNIYSSTDAHAFAPLQVDGSTLALNSNSGAGVAVGKATVTNADSFGRVLDVGGANHGKSVVTTTGGIETGVYSHDSGFWGAPVGGLVGTRSNHPLTFVTNQGSKMTILASGNVGIGTTSPGEMLDVANGNLVLSTNTAGTAGSLKFEENAANGNNFVAFKAPALLAGDTTYTLPNAYPGSNMVLQSDNAGALTWVADDTGTSGVTTMAAVGAVPNANGASISGVNLTLQPADATNPGVVTAGTQTIAGAKTFSSVTSVPLGAVGAPGLYFGTDVNTGVWSPGADIFAVSTAGTERMRVDAAGKVGIGVTAPTQLLDVVGGNFRLQKLAAGALGPRLILDNTAGNGQGSMDFYTIGGADPNTNLPSARWHAVDDGNYSGNMYFQTKDTGGTGGVLNTRLAIMSSGNVGIGTATPGATLSVHNGAVAISSWEEISQISGTINGSSASYNAVIGLDMTLRNERTGAGNTQLYGTAVTVQGTSDAKQQEVFGSSVWLESHDTDRAYGIFVDDWNTTGGTQYGVYISNNDTDATNYGIYQVGASTNNYFNGNVGIGATSPGEKLDIVGNIRAQGQFYAATVADNDATIDWNNSNSHTATNAPGAIAFLNMKDGGSYVLALTDTTGGTYSFSQAGLTFRCSPAGGGGAASITAVAAKQTLVNFIRLGSNVYCTYISDF